MALLLGTLGSSAISDCCWCDSDTPKSAQTTIGSDSQVHTLVFSDEFNKPGRDFANGKDTKWTGLKIGDTSNMGAAFYLPEQATVVQDEALGESSLRIRTENGSYTGDTPTGDEGITMPFRSAMLQTWNKFCFTGGIVEYRARMPRGAGYWPALWTFGNLGRAVYQNSNTGLWPWSYDQCDDDLVVPPTGPPQRISACMDHDLEKDGLHPFQGRGATELDVLEGAVTNDGVASYVVGSLQLSPGIPAVFRPPMFGFPTKSGPGEWYQGLDFGKEGFANNGWYGPPWGSNCPTGCPDALSGGIVDRDNLDTKYWTYRMEWKLGKDGGLKWFYDGDYVWGLGASAFSDYEHCDILRRGDKEEKICQRTPPRQIPQEPMSLIMNTAIGTWNGGVSSVDGKHWPADFYIDYVRVWQDEVNIGCDPPNFPTADYINKNAELYGELVSPVGSDTCPEIYPDSAYAHAAAIQARAAKMRAAAVSEVATAGASTLPALMASTMLFSQNNMGAADMRVQDATASSKSSGIWGFAAVVLMAAGAAAAFVRQRAPYKMQGLAQLDEAELAGEYHLAQ